MRKTKKLMKATRKMRVTRMKRIAKRLTRKTASNQ